MSKYLVSGDQACTQIRVQRSAVVTGLDDLPGSEADTVIYDFSEIPLLGSAMVGVLFRRLRERGMRRTVLRMTKGSFSILRLLGIGSLPDVLVDIQIVAPADGASKG